MKDGADLHQSGAADFRLYEATAKLIFPSLQFPVSRNDFVRVYSVTTTVAYKVNTKGLSPSVLLEFFATEVWNPAPSKPSCVKGIHWLAGRYPVSRAGTRRRYGTRKAWNSKHGLNMDCGNLSHHPLVAMTSEDPLLPFLTDVTVPL